MSRSEQILAVFVASPSDVDVERSRLESVINEINITWSREQGVRFELVSWETHAFPGFGVDAQSIINEQIPNDFDVFIGIMWHRFGTPTGRAGSGTEEEFIRAKERFDQNKNSVHLMVYFKSAPIDVNQIDGLQLAKVQEFQKSLGPKGGLYWTFSDTDEFERYVRLHLQRYMQEFKKKHSLASVQQSDIPNNPVPSKGDTDQQPGFLDLEDSLEEHFQQLTLAAARITEAIEELGNRMNHHAEEMNQLAAGGRASVDRKTVKRLISRTVLDMDVFSTRMETEVPVLSKALRQGIKDILGITALTVESPEVAASPDEITKALAATSTLRSNIYGTSTILQDFRGTVDRIPRMTMELNRSKQRLIDTLATLISEFESSDSQLLEAERLFRSLQK